MVLCATNDDHSVVQLVEPPAGANPGDRVTFAGFFSEPATIAQMAKKKIFEKLAPKVCCVFILYSSCFTSGIPFKYSNFCS